jgi:hypothetical protein
MRVLRRIFGFNLFTDYNETSGISDKSAPASVDILYECPDPICRGLGRSLDLDPVCEGIAERTHAETVMRPALNQDQEETVGLIVNGDEIGQG